MRFQEWYNQHSGSFVGEDLARAAWNAAIDAAADQPIHRAMFEDEIEKLRHAFGPKWEEELHSIWRSQSSIIKTLKD
jgi:hypothetical protein